uniref:Uncharacterized protein n=1 Tax=Bursaphelenchus xylophilus TaxID=6326 RepID=A0A1I7RJ45_BURXY
MKDFELEWSQMAKFHRKDSLKPEEETIPFKFHVEWLFPKLMSTSKRAARQKFLRRLIQDFLCFGRMKDFELEWSQMAKFHRKDSLKPEEETIPFKFHVEWLFPKLMSTSKR